MNYSEEELALAREIAPDFKTALEKRKVLELTSWHSCASDFKEEQVGNMRLKKAVYSKGIYRNYGVSGWMFLNIKKPINIMRLQEKRGNRWYDWMVDDPPHYYAMKEYAAQAHGHVLVAGLGLGMLAIELAKNPEVKTITIVERSQDVMSLVGKYLPLGRKEETVMMLVLDDFYKFIEKPHPYFDTIIVDLWVSDGLEETIKLAETEVKPLREKLGKLFPQASLTFHGFMYLSDLKPWGSANV